jgi:hypothetical protein
VFRPSHRLPRCPICIAAVTHGSARYGRGRSEEGTGCNQPCRTSGKPIRYVFEARTKVDLCNDLQLLTTCRRVPGRAVRQQRINLRALGVSAIGAFVRRHAPRHGRGWAAQMVTALRSFFRFAQLQGVIKLDLAALVPSVPSWEISGPPKYLRSEAVQRVLSACDRSTVSGKRDFVIFLLLARLGLRAVLGKSSPYSLTILTGRMGNSLCVPRRGMAGHGYRC